MKKLSKRTISILVFLLCVLFSNAQTDLAEHDLRGKVKSVFDVTYKLILEKNKSSNTTIKKEEKTNELKQLYKFSKEGKLTEDCRFNPDGSIYDKSIYVYDTDNKDVMTEEFRYKQDNHLYLKYVYSYDEHGNISIRTGFTLDEILSEKYIYSYDEENVNTEINCFDSNEELQRTYKFLRNSNKIEEKLFNSEGELLQTKLCIFDSAGKQIEENLYNTEGLSERKYACKYDAAGNKIEETLCNYGVLIYTITALFDEAGLRIEDTKTEYKPDGTIQTTITSKYTYDDQNNWIKKIIIKNEIPRFVLERKIKYYK